MFPTGHCWSSHKHANCKYQARSKQEVHLSELSHTVRPVALCRTKRNRKPSLLRLSCAPVCLPSQELTKSSVSSPFYTQPRSSEVRTSRTCLTVQGEAGMESHGRDDVKGPVLHIVVVGFHHKKGCQVHEPCSMLMQLTTNKGTVPLRFRHL